MKKYITICLLAGLLISCKTTMTNITPAEDKVHAVKLGMTKEKVISIMGTYYQIVGQEASCDGPVETLGYYDYTNGMYKFHIQNNLLIKWEYSPGIKYNYSRHPE
ncbi:MAG: hypothetical protein LIP01_14455 [Tannerellaceae bacterium]|nr:hypothetical protein [Tannerellaceae bacterium]